VNDPGPVLDGDLGDSEPIAASALTKEARLAAITSSFSLLATYFSSGSNASVLSQRGPSYSDDTDPSTSLVIAALQLRVALAASDKFVGIVERVRRRANFRYQTIRRDTEGWPQGRLDTIRFARSSGKVTNPIFYPVINIARANVTPENTLVVSAAQWLMKELVAPTLTAFLPVLGPERRAATTARVQLRRLMADPIFAACQKAAEKVKRQGGMQGLLSQVRKRLNAGHVGNPVPYRELVDWMTACLNGKPAVEAGDMDWSFYGKSFDTKLFELWCLSEIGRALGLALQAPPDRPLLWERFNKPMFSWATTAGDLEVFFQRGMSGLGPGREARWQRTDTERRLGGIPDISAVVRRLHGPTELVILDSKLRQRESDRSEELYKLLGYFNNFQLDEYGHGAVIFYANRNSPYVYTYATDVRGQLLAVSLDPADTVASRPAIAAIAALVLQPLGLASLAASLSREPQSEHDTEDLVARSQEVQVSMLRAVAASMGMEGIRPWVSQAEAMLGDSWQSLEWDVKEIIATAIYVGNVLEGDRDYSGPILGLAAAAENLLWNWVLEPAALEYPQISQTKMLGAAIDLLNRAVAGRDAPAEMAVRTVLARTSGLSARLATLLEPLQEMNREFRREAAHRKLLTRAQWLACQRFMLIGSEPLLPRLAAALTQS